MTELPKAYDPATVEPELYKDWDGAGLFHAEPDDDGEPFSIVIPPPNVTGSLHVGHALDNTIQDVLVRRERMRGRNAVWIPGTDHAGIATQNVVERLLAAEGTDRHTLGREAFIERVWQFRAASGGTILTQLRELGASADWRREVFTFDEVRSRAVREVFVALYEQGLIYRGNRLINWCPRCETALSDIEVEHKDVDGQLTRFIYPFVDGERDATGQAAGDAPVGMEVATTRPETMLGDTAIAVHPDDERWAAAVGRHVRHPFQDRTFAVIADDYVDPEFGSGAVKITPAHDPNDHAMAERHDLEIIDIFDETAVTTDVVGERFADLDRFEARKRVVQALEEEGLLVGVETHRHSVGHCSRCDTVVEPRLSLQWFVSMRPLAERAAQAVRDGAVEFVPQSSTKPFLDWLDNLHDWCISRQIWWGHRIPAWYGPDGEIRVCREDIDEPGWLQDDDVLDTWFSSQLWPFSVFGWPDDTPELSTWFPTSTLVTGYDINTFWVSRMVMISLWFTDKAPFKVVHNHGLVRDEHGKKMSKSFGNVIDPLDLIHTYGADATRFALLRSAAPGTDVPLAEEWVEGTKRFANKLWNAGRFALANLDGRRPGALPAVADLSIEDRWILSRLERMHANVDAAYDAYDWPVVARNLYHFVWDEFADWYLEAIKIRVYGDDPAAADVARSVLAYVLDRVLRLLHPFMPFVTEALWRALTGATGGTDSLMVADWPAPDSRLADADIERDFDVLKGLVTEVNRFRSLNGIAPSARFDVKVTSARAELLTEHGGLVATLARLSSVDVVLALEDAPGRSTIMFGGGQAQVDLRDLIDIGAEIDRLDREIARIDAELAKVAGKLSNESFVARAPEDVVARERARHAELNATREELEARRTSLGAIDD
ncbi:MAG: valine--tRNA ligase [Nitriliruptoraceae bacterium]